MARPKGSKNTKPSVVNLADIEPKNPVELEKVEENLDKMEQVLENVQQISQDFQEKVETTPEIVNTLTPEEELNAVITAEVEETPVQKESPAEVEVEWPYLLDGQGKRVPAKEVEISSIDFGIVVGEWMKAAKQGAQLNSRRLPQLDYLPYRLHILTLEGVEAKPQELLSEGDYLEVLVSHVDRWSFLETLRQLAVDGGFIAANHRATQKPFNANVFIRSPVQDTPHTRLKGNKPKYTREELKEFSLEQLRIAAQWYDPEAGGRSKDALAKKVLELQ